MPELPEVETVVRTLEHLLLNQCIISVDLRVASFIENDSLPMQSLVGKEFHTFTRRGKYLVFGIGDVWFIVHLRMEGKFHVYTHDAAPVPNKHTHMILTTDSMSIHYLDVRKFTKIAIVTDVDAYFKSKKLGLEPFDNELTTQYLIDHYRRRSRVIKTVLLDQSIVAGIGNIYADEILFASKINPLRPANSLTRSECDTLITETKRVLTEAINAGGTTIRSYTSSLAVTGRFQLVINVYGRKGKPCKRCGSILIGQMLNGRSTVWCRECQEEKL